MGKGNTMQTKVSKTATLVHFQHHYHLSDGWAGTRAIAGCRVGSMSGRDPREGRDQGTIPYRTPFF